MTRTSGVVSEYSPMTPASNVSSVAQAGPTDGVGTGGLSGPCRYLSFKNPLSLCGSPAFSQNPPGVSPLHNLRFPAGNGNCSYSICQEDYGPVCTETTHSYDLFNIEHRLIHTCDTLFNGGFHQYSINRAASPGRLWWI